MKTALKFVMVALLGLTLAACKKEEVKPEPTPEPAPQQQPQQPETQPLPPLSDNTDPRNLDREGSLLSKRVILFDFDKSTIRPEYREILAAHGEFMAANSNYQATLEGHADERGTREYNLGLGERRADSVADVLDAQGAAGSQLSNVSYGEERPVCTASNESCWQRNRRVEIIYTRN